MTFSGVFQTFLDVDGISRHLQVVPGSQMVMAADFAKRRKQQLIDAAKRTLDFFCAMAIGMASLPAMARCSKISGTKQPKRQRWSENKW